MIFVFNSKIKLSDVCVKKTFFIFLLPGLVYSLLFFFLVQNRLPANTELIHLKLQFAIMNNKVVHKCNNFLLHPLNFMRYDIIIISVN